MLREFIWGQISSFGGTVQGLSACLSFSDVFHVYRHSGGKGGVPSIQNDHQFGIALDALLKKDKFKVQVSVEFDTDDMEGFRIKEVVCVTFRQFILILFVVYSTHGIQPPMQWAAERMNWHMGLEYVHSSLPPSFFHVSSGSSS
jgi:hypothetical protein